MSGAFHGERHSLCLFWCVCVCCALACGKPLFLTQFVSVLGVCDMRGSMIHCFFRDWGACGCVYVVKFGCVWVECVFVSVFRSGERASAHKKENGCRDIWCMSTV